MTLVLSFAAHGFSVQVADRLVSQRRGSFLSPLDQIANKLLIYRARDAVVSIGYAGQAFIGEIPTDEWLAQLISGEPNVRGPDDMGGVRFGRTPNNWDIGKAIRRIRDELPQHIAPRKVIYVCIVGHQISRRGLVRPLLCEIALQSNKIQSFHQSPRQLRTGAGCISSIGVEIGDQERERIITWLRDADPPLTPDQIAGFLTDSIRKHEQPGVGPHTSAVIIPFPGSATVRSNFFAGTPHHILIRSAQSDLKLETGYSPWVIGPDLIKAPTADVGGMTLSTGGIEIECQVLRRLRVASLASWGPWTDSSFHLIRAGSYQTSLFGPAITHCATSSADAVNAASAFFHGEPVHLPICCQPLPMSLNISIPSD